MSTTTNEAGTLIVDAETYEPHAASAVTLTDPHGAAAEQYRVLRHRLECLGKAGVRALGFTSAQSGEGRTTTVVNAALALGRGGRNRVVLVDGDLRRPGVHTLLGLRPQLGLVDVVGGRAELSQCLWQFGTDELYILPAGKPPEDLPRTLYDARLPAMLAELKRSFDFVLVDVPPVLPLADVPTMCAELDGVLLVVRAGVTARDMVGAALDALYGVTVHGLVLNEVDPRATSTLGFTTAPEATRALPPRRG
jgi:receptor protein-tyrosine kinase